jgi:hypothetical protein
MLKYSEYTGFVKFLVFMAGGDADKVDDNTVTQAYQGGWEPIAAARQIMQNQTNGEYLRIIHQQKQGA